MGETLYRRPEILFRWGRLCFDTESPGEISYQSRRDSVSGETLFRDTGDGDKQLVICGSSHELSCREVIRQVAAAPQSSQYPLQTRPVLHRSEAPPCRGDIK